MFSYISRPVIAEVGLAMMEGGHKYGRHNYRPAGVRASIYLDDASGREPPDLIARSNGVWTLERGLDEEFTPEVRSSWAKVYHVLAATMQAGAAEVANVVTGKSAGQ